ncbi:hypothetical protein [Dictyobacter formicarum]|uniref:DUF403 domain-containing protein n=1 Tax=Dictyobacter formicarum TaxID=2778368 RepID=A0ABQ3VR95_9CHLR|nr:hypothetical protein [Dictyobacter formicarum]GHO88236.1 hypothetical protein KSZ_62420 [Dictyobacter formicarum]
MVALRNISSQGQAQQQDQQSNQRRAAWLIMRMDGMYWRMARRERKLRNIGEVLCQDLAILPMQCQEAMKHLLALRQAAQAAYSFYSQLDPQAMKVIAPWGTLTKLAYLDDQITELLLLLDALTPICSEPSYARVQLQLMVRHLYPLMFATFDELAGQLSALVEKAQESQAEAGEEGQA